MDTIGLAIFVGGALMLVAFAVGVYTLWELRRR